MISYDHERVFFRLAWVAMAVNAAAILAFGLVYAILPGVDASGRAVAAASIGLGLASFLIAIRPFRRRERWAWWALAYLPIFWAWHYFGDLPPGKDHVHQIVLFGLAVFALVAARIDDVTRIR